MVLIFITLLIFFNVLINFFNWNSPEGFSSKSDLDLTVLIPARNEESNIKNCLDSIDPEIELIKEYILIILSNTYNKSIISILQDNPGIKFNTLF